MQGRTAEAMALYREAGDEPDALNNLGVLQGESGNAVEARTAFEKAAGLGSAAASYNLYKLDGNAAALARAQSLEPALVETQREFMEGRFMFSPLDPAKIEQMTSVGHDLLWIRNWS